MSLVVQLNMLDTSSNIVTDASFSPPYVVISETIDGRLYQTISVTNIQSKFKFSSNDVLNDYNVDGSLSNSDVVSVYPTETNLFNGASYALSTYVYSSSAIVAPIDVSYNTLIDYLPASSTLYGKTTETFIQHVAESVIGSKLAVDMLLNEDELGDSYVDSINECVTLVNGQFFPTIMEPATQAARKIYDVMTHDKPERFGMKYNATSSDIADASGVYLCTATKVAIAGTPAEVTVEIDPTTRVVKNIVVTSSSGPGVYLVGDPVSFEIGGGVVVTSIASINPVQAAMLNGTLDSATSMPFEASDRLTLKFIVKTRDNQLNVSGNMVSAAIRVGIVVDVV